MMNIVFGLVVFLLVDVVVLKHARMTVEDLVERCGSLKETRICDPDGILKKGVDGIKREIEIMSANYTCGSPGCKSTNTSCDMYIVINKGMLTQYKDNHLLEEAKRFANELMTKLISDTCGNTFLLYYSHLDHVFYVVTKEGVNKLLPSDLIGEMALMNKVKLNTDIVAGLKHLIENFRMAFRGEYTRKVHFSEPVHGAMMAVSFGSSHHHHLHWIVLSTSLVLL